MELFNGICSENSARVSSRFFEVNNYGVFRALEHHIFTRRPAGRPDYQMIYVKAGRMTYEECGNAKTAEAGTLVLYRPHEAQMYRYHRGAEGVYVWFHFTGTGCEELLGDLFSGDRTCTVGAAHEIDEALQDLRTHVIGDDSLSQTYACGRMMMLFAELQRHDTHRDHAMERVLVRLRQERFGEGSNAAYAAMAGMSEAQFLRRFTAYTGMTPHKYKTQLLLRQAAELLRDTEMNVGEVADALGIDDSLYFSRMFKKAYGVSPLTYRKE